MERPDLLDGIGAAFMDAFVGNPPFLGGSFIHDKGHAFALERQWNNLVGAGDVARG